MVQPIINIAEQAQEDVTRYNSELKAALVQMEGIQNRINYLTRMRDAAARELEEAKKVKVDGKLQISDYIKSILTEGRTHTTTEITEMFADYVDKTPNDVKNNVANALSRLKGVKAIESKTVYGQGRAGGSKWFLITDNNKHDISNDAAINEGLRMVK